VEKFFITELNTTFNGKVKSVLRLLHGNMNNNYINNNFESEFLLNLMLRFYLNI